MTNRTELLFISWQPHCSRSDSIAKRIGGVSEMVYAAFWGSHYSTIVLKYVWQSFSTLGTLIKYRPRVVFVMAPPVIACFAVWLYCAVTRGKFVIDAHTGAFIDSPWEKFSFLQRFFSRRADLTIVTNQHLKDLVEGWNAKSYIVGDVPISFDEEDEFHGEPASVEDIDAAGDVSQNSQDFDAPVRSERQMTLVSSFTSDEPIDQFLSAAACVPDVTFYITGDNRKLDKELRETTPENVRFTGFLPDDQYVKLLRSSDAVIALTNSDHTMQRGAYEGIYLARPVITSDFPILHQAFPKGAEHVACNVDSIVKGILRVRDDLCRYEIEARQLRSQKLERWNTVANELTMMLNLPAPPAKARPGA